MRWNVRLSSESIASSVVDSQGGEVGVARGVVVAAVVHHVKAIGSCFGVFGRCRRMSPV